ncbi:prenyltransferase/squalene oxidase repeat-containing protein [Alteriqipengyuania lutimaris]|uniref:squalene--hopene cyclase n=1 Tax=Alteriqipengyuania lutimaris TaxID=1538146 RepID=UPI0015F1B087|nr:squalene--hopene cyclase [Alteriqipengyuania lutimaris]MBB3033827.1 hypothetical protein [Alteriqipengyuania lutimaris]
MLSQPDIRPASLAVAREHARDFLLAAQREDGTWHDFFLPAGESNDWVTAYVAGALATTGDAEEEAAARRGWNHLRSAQKLGGGWGYNAATPPDADSTIWALRLAHAIGEGASGEAAHGYEFLASHVRQGEGIATYASQSAPRDYVGLPATVDFRGWVRPHVCVTAAAAALPGPVGEAARASLPAMQAADGHWPSYWWFDPGYASAEAVDALGPGEAADAAIAFARTRIDVLLMMDEPPAFALAQCIRILARCGRHVPDAAIAMLATGQAGNGSWPASARLRVPRPDRIAPEEAGWRQWTGLSQAPQSLDDLLAMTFTITSLDHRRAFTTATVLRALDAVAP